MNDVEELTRRFSEHEREEKVVHAKTEEMHEAVFRKADTDTGTPPGLLQLTAQMNERLRNMEIANDRQKRFLGGVFFSFSCLGFFLTDSAHKLMTVLKGL